MTIRSQRILITLTASTLLIGGLATAAFCIVRPVQIEAAAKSAVVLTAADGRAPPISRPTPDEWSAVAGKRLRFVPPPPPQVTPPPAAVPDIRPPNVQLVGTIVEPGRSLALFAASPGRIELKQVGEDVGGSATVEEVHPDHIVLLHAGRRITIALPQRKETP